MAKGQKRSNREIKKPKQDKPKAVAPTSLLSTASPKKNPMTPGKKK